ncbi:hypothetical protein [Chitinophaga japonensis]|uniref:Dolichyl-phosphate-mannose-protein mannosyltransferase n=1 Tax=Chitinophaga japonensis TaxID=104662 RepID=A0A562SZH2_CHIJA|nr:hypothetical protein [Chitinophaga japonensis]TWI86689.1 hypothetical protein LX66_3952 [Chitinophaga japonensis]
MLQAHKRYLWIALAGGLLQFIIFKILYPFPDFISDSYSYMDTNLYHMTVNLWPIGYSRFIALVRLFTPSHTVLVLLQYMILEAALLYFFFSLLRLYGLPRWGQRVLFIFLFFNPLFLYLANCVLSDALFCAVSLVILTLYLRMFRQPRISHIVVTTLLIGLAFTIRYTAIYYPLTGIVALLLAAYRWPLKIAGIVAPWALIVPFILYTQQQTKAATGTAEFSVFGGWQIANNALYMYEHIEVDTTQLPPGTLELDRMARRYFREVPPEQRVLADIEGTFFIKMPNAILKPYMLARYHNFVDAPTHFRAWGAVSPVYKAYGTHLIKQHPFAFARYYLWPNTKNYFLPYLEKFGFYNIGMRRMFGAAVVWFQLDSDEVRLLPSIYFQGYVFALYPLFFMVMNVYFAGCFLFFCLGGKWRNNSRLFNAAVLLTAAFLFLNFCFSVFATPVVLRYQVVPMVLLVGFSLLLTVRILLPAAEPQTHVSPGQPPYRSVPAHTP